MSDHGLPWPFSTPAADESRCLSRDPGNRKNLLLDRPPSASYLTMKEVAQADSQQQNRQATVSPIDPTLPPAQGPAQPDTTLHVAPLPVAVSCPQRIGRYRVERHLKRGGFGQVFLAHDDDLRRSVAIKVPHPERISGPEDAELYLAEARLVAGLDHPSVVPVYDLGRCDDGLPFVVSKFIEGSDLESRMRASRLDFASAAEVVATIADALNYAHCRRVVHRDIKPANILLDARGK